MTRHPDRSENIDGNPLAGLTDHEYEVLVQRAVDGNADALNRLLGVGEQEPTP